MYYIHIVSHEDILIDMSSDIIMEMIKFCFSNMIYRDDDYEHSYLKFLISDWCFCRKKNQDSQFIEFNISEMFYFYLFLRIIKLIKIIKLI